MVGISPLRMPRDNSTCQPHTLTHLPPHTTPHSHTHTHTALYFTCYTHTPHIHLRDTHTSETLHIRYTHTHIPHTAHTHLYLTCCTHTTHRMHAPPTHSPFVLWDLPPSWSLSWYHQHESKPGDSLGVPCSSPCLAHHLLIVGVCLLQQKIGFWWLEPVSDPHFQPPPLHQA